MRGGRSRFQHLIPLSNHNMNNIHMFLNLTAGPYLHNVYWKIFYKMDSTYYTYSAYPIHIINSLNVFISRFLDSFLVLAEVVWDYVLSRLIFIEIYYVRSANMWGDGFLLDFLQKKTMDLWIRQYVIYTGFIFSERFIFYSIVRSYVDNIVWPTHRLNIFEYGSIGGMVNTVIFIYLGTMSLIMIMFSLFVS